MHKHLIIAAFEKAKIHSKLEGITNPSKNRLSIILSVYVSEDFGFPFSSKRLRDYFTLAKSLEDKIGDINISQQEVIKGLCQYLEYDSYQAFLESYNTQTINKDEPITPTQNQNISFYFKRYKTTIIGTITLLILVTYIIKTNQERWMKWNGETYEETNFEPDSLKNGVLLLFSEEQAGHFKKLPKCDCDTDFFNPDGSAKVWYSKNKDKTIDCFNHPGLHPETGKTLKPISTYMIKNYLCKE